MAVRRGDLLDQMAEAQFVQRSGAVFAERGELAEDGAATADLLLEQPQILGESAGGRVLRSSSR